MGGKGQRQCSNANKTKSVGKNNKTNNDDAVDSIKATTNKGTFAQTIPSDQHQEKDGLTLMEPKSWWTTSSMLQQTTQTPARTTLSGQHK
jgi:hypothetical protein